MAVMVMASNETNSTGAARLFLNNTSKAPSTTSPNGHSPDLPDRSEHLTLRAHRWIWRPDLSPTGSRPSEDQFGRLSTLSRQVVSVPSFLFLTP